jgi:hypothetical protein
MNSLKKLKEKLQQQRKHLDELDKHISDLVRSPLLPVIVSLLPRFTRTNLADLVGV